MDPLKARIAQLEDQLIRAFNERDKASLIEAQVNLRAALEEKERREFDLNSARCFMASRNLTYTLN